ncbi:hypothetical protein HLB44_24525 [Aquincola sp. S2]|uniref:Transporter substrate-binding domain-containing protein n=1 Tax=Pseudaquabacterium terrae TaxID=2732868 RepID=A0ABX2ENN4_9BURK|nr:hypothetical protein [Aquabacterium terrae]NRF70177.1 hypothetical protein [Aquabacterium terrae]
MKTARMDPHVHRRRVLLAALPGAAAAGPARANPPAWAQPFVLGTHQRESTFHGRWLRLIYTEAFRRLGVPLTMAVYPLQRLTQMLDRDEIDGDVGRVPGFGEDHRSLLRVDESVWDLQLGLFGTNAALPTLRLDDLRGSAWRGVYVRGVAICEQLLKPLLPSDQLSALSSETQGLHMLLAGRADFMCTTQFTMLELQLQPEFRQAPPARRLVTLGTIPMHPYVQRRHAGLAGRLATVLRELKSEGTIERQRLQVLREMREQAVEPRAADAQIER